MLGVKQFQDGFESIGNIEKIDDIGSIKKIRGLGNIRKWKIGKLGKYGKYGKQAGAELCQAKHSLS